MIGFSASPLSLATISDRTEIVTRAKASERTRRGIANDLDERNGTTGAALDTIAPHTAIRSRPSKIAAPIDAGAGRCEGKRRRS